MQIGAFSVSLAVKDLQASRQFYEQLGFQGMFDRNILTFNPGWDQSAQPVAGFTDVRELQRSLKSAGVPFLTEADDSTSGPASFMIADPDGNTILFDQHV